MMKTFTDQDVQAYFDRANTLEGSATRATALYDEWAAHYDTTLEHFGRYLSPGRIASLAWGLRPDPALRVLDVACGTGRIGAALAERGYRNLTGVDLSAGMLARASARGCYASLIQADFSGFDPGSGYDIIVSAGVLTMGHLGSDALDRMMTALAPAGLLISDIEEGTFNDQNIAALLARHLADGRLARYALEPGHFYEPAPDEPMHGRFLTAERR